MDLTKQIFPFAKNEMAGKAFNKDVLGGKGAALCVMASQGLNVPPGFIIPTTICNEYRIKSAKEKAILIENLLEEVLPHMAALEAKFGYRPLVSVRSGAPVSMPGMMDTILNVGLTADNQKEWEARIGERATLDSQRRLLQMLGATAYGVPAEAFEFQLAKVKKAYGVKADTDLDCKALSDLILAYVSTFGKATGLTFPGNSALDQLRAAIVAVFDSWDNPRAVEYRKINGISEVMGTAVVVQAMVFGNMGEDSGTGVLFTRDPATGARVVIGEYLTNAQGEDVVAGVRTPLNFNEMLLTLEKDATPLTSLWDNIYHELLTISDLLEKTYRDMVDIEFTVQKGELFVLQSRTGKRAARAAFKIAYDLVTEGTWTKLDALKGLTRDQFKTVRRPTVDTNYKVKPQAIGLAACPGVAVGKAVFSADEALACPVPCILITHETNPNDIAGMAKAAGVLTKTGGATSHAAVVARAMDKVCVVGCTSLDIEALHNFSGNVTICGATGRVWIGHDVPVIDAASDVAVNVVMDWCVSQYGGIEAVATPPDNQGPYVVRLADTWGSEVVFKAILSDLVALGSLHNVVLDLRSPEDFRPEADKALLEAFGTKSADPWASKARLILKAKAKDLAGLKVTGVFDPQIGLEWIDPAGIKSVPAEYATFSILKA